ncbi:lytic transglycosylase domain-containing protein [Allomuricauda sp. ARW1Y1]|jgi:membrane-bound lytic murein transglycosylase D|uniref:lytic transglycosylase domain-containing protein n=1 Tax=Allomuricauda sp. ARW1Y1 TaxID=2663843 RepID=UPI0015C732F1|nr:lytic transglycosylase domain-containing protein [Muricauda sp. ARW1Y1]NYJ26388.1 membrane-bound lytic murein transglycosylase D [Muricauda sp. ARW1Y1]
MNQRLKIAVFAAMLSVAPYLSAQQDGKQEEEKDSIMLQEEEEGVVAVSNIKIDGQLMALETHEDGKFKLRDLEEAWRYDSLWLNELHSNAELFSDMLLEVQNGPGQDSIFVVDLPTDTLKARLARMNEKTPFNITYNSSLESVIKSFLTRRRDLMQRMMTASQFYFPLFEQELDNQNIPLEIKYLAIVESALNPKAMSRVGAKGLWQFMYSTGKMYGLDVSSYVDERHDPIMATKAASKYLSRLYDIFGDWDLALAAYNSGPGNVNKAIRRSGGYENYWNIRPFLPRETAGYLPAFLATMYIFEYAEEHGLQYKKAERPYFETDTIHVKNLITFDQISKLVDISTEELEMLNPAYKLNIIPKVEGKNYALRLPTSKIGKFVANEEEIYAFVKKELDSLEKPLPSMITAQDQIRYRVKSGDYLGKIAERYGVGVSQIKRWNGLRSNNLRVGQRLTIFPRKPYVAETSSKSSASKSSNTVANGAKVHTVQSGDSLWTISKKYPGVTIENLREWNGISGNNLKPGTKLKLCDCSS